MTDLAPCLEAALWFAGRGWPVLPIKPQAKEPLSAHGVADATLDPALIRRWFVKWPNGNVGIACGAPGPRVLDIDDLVAGHDALVVASHLAGPDVATARGRQFYFVGTDEGTIGLGWGELRGRGSYVVAPPSVHPSGKLYVYLIEPTLGALPPLPNGIVPGDRSTAGAGVFEAPELIPYGSRHQALVDYAVRMVRSGIVDVPTLELALRSFYEARCVTTPKARKDEFRKIAVWAVQTHIATRERAFGDHDPDTPATTKTKKQPTGLENPPRGDAPLKEHREYLRIAGGWGDRVDIDSVKRWGANADDKLEIRLTNGQVIAFRHQENVAKRGHWGRVVTLATSGIANPVYLNDLAGQHVLRSLCVLADTPAFITEAEELADVVGDFVRMTEDIDLHDLTTADGRYNATDHCRARGGWDPRKADTEHRPVLLVCRGGSGNYVRGGELRDYLNSRGHQISSAQLPGQLGMVGLERVALNGREARQPDRAGRATNHMVVYRLLAEAGEDG
jgi:hypothetical protein